MHGRNLISQIIKVTIEASDGNEPIAQAIVIVQALHIQAHLTPSSTLHVTPTSQYSGRQQITKNMSTQTVNEQSNSQTVNFSPKMGVQSMSKTPHVCKFHLKIQDISINLSYKYN